MRSTSSRRAETVVIRIVTARFYNLLSVSPMIDSRRRTRGQRDVHARGILVEGVTSTRARVLCVHPPGDAAFPRCYANERASKTKTILGSASCNLAESDNRLQFAG